MPLLPYPSYAESYQNTFPLPGKPSLAGNVLSRTKRPMDPKAMKRGSAKFSLPPDTNVKDVLAAVRRHFSLRAESSTPHVQHYFDSFDWLLHEAETALYLEDAGSEKHLYWTHLADDTPTHSLPVSEPPRFAKDLPPSHFCDALAPVLGYRALLPVVDVAYHRRVFRVLNDDEKTTARLVIEEQATATNATPGHSASLNATLYIAPLKGYHKTAQAVSRLLRTELALPEHDTPLLLDALNALGHTPDRTAAKNDPVLDAALRADEAVRLLLRSLLQTIVLNEPGLRADIDTEFLHDFRVAVRRTRSVLSQLKSIFPSDVLDSYRPAFKWLGNITGPTRDLDVYLRKFETYQSWVPPRVQNDLEPLRDFLTTEQRRVQRRMVKALDSPRYRALIDGWRVFLDGPAPNPPSSLEAVRPVLEVASARIWRTYKKVIKEGRAIVNNPDAPAQALHDLRIRCKKLRYLLELFRSLYPAKALKRSIKALKNLQDNLGDFNDFEVQQDTLQQFAVQMMKEGRTEPETFLAMGRLEAYMEQRQHETREAFAERFTRFAAPKNQKQFKALFKRDA